jgi:lipoprotein NlpI
LAVIILPNIQSLIQRSDAFSTFDKGDYATALGQFQKYLADNSDDTEALFYAARAAIKTGNHGYAVSAMEKITQTQDYSTNPDFLFNYALLVAPSNKALEALNTLIVMNPGHAGGRLLRGIMLAEQGEVRQAREDFLQADDVLRSDPDTDVAAIYAVHKRVEANLKFKRDYGTPSPDIDTVLRWRLKNAFGVAIGADFYINAYESLRDSNVTEKLTPSNIIAVHYTRLLLEEEDFNEAQVEISQFSESTLKNSPAAASLVGLRLALIGKTEEAAIAFQSLTKTFPKSATGFINAANSIFSSQPTIAGAISALALLDQAINLEHDNAIARSNRAALHMMLGNWGRALADVKTIANITADQTHLLKLLLEIKNGQEDISSLAQAVPEHDLSKRNALAAHSIANGDYDTAIYLLQPTEQDLANNFDSLLHYVDLLYDTGLYMRARNVLQEAQKRTHKDGRVDYQLGLVALAVGDINGAKEHLNTLSEQESYLLQSSVLEALILHQEKNKIGALAAFEQGITATENSSNQAEAAMRAAPVLFDTNTTLLRELLSAADSLPPAGRAMLAQLQTENDPAAAYLLAKKAASESLLYDTQYHAGLAMVALGNPAEALSMLQAATVWKPADVNLLEIVATLQDSQNLHELAAKTTAAIDNIRHALKGEKMSVESYRVLSPPDAKLSQSIAAALQNDSNSSTVIAGFQQLLAATKTNEQKALLHFQRGTFFLALRKYADSVADIKQALALKVENENDALFYLAKNFMFLNKYEQAFAIYQQLAETFPKTPLYRRLAGDALVSNEDIDAAITYLQETIAFFPLDIPSYISLADAHSRAKDTSSSIAVLRQAARATPLYAPIYKALYKKQTAFDMLAAKENNAVLAQLIDGS